MIVRSRILSIVLLTSIAAAACNRGGAPTPASPTSPPSTSLIALRIKGHTNAAPSLATWGSTVAITWTASAEGKSDIYLSVSTDGGTSFGNPVRVNDVSGDARAAGEQAARVVIGASRVIHVAWPSKRGDHAVILYASSKDNGMTFSPAVPIAGEQLSGARGWHAITLGYDGAVHAIWLDGRNAGAMHHDHGSAAPAMKMAPGSEHAGPRQDIFHAMWKDDGPHTEVSIAANVCFCCKTAIATSGEHVYAAWRHIFPGGVRDIAIAHSKDNGVTFGAPVRVSDDGWKLDACPDDGPAMAADSHGGLHLTWPTLVPGATPHKGIFYASLSPNDPITSPLRLDSGESDPAHPQIGSDVHGASAIVWDEPGGDARRIVLRRVSTSGIAAPAEVFTAAGATYPVVAAGEGVWITVWSAEGPDGTSIIEGRRIPFAEKH